MDWLDLLAVQGTLQHHSSKASTLRCSPFFTVQLSHPFMTSKKTIALTRRTFVGKVMSLLLNMLSRLVITFLPRSKGPATSSLWAKSHTLPVLLWSQAKKGFFFTFKWIRGKKWNEDYFITFENYVAFKCWCPPDKYFGTQPWPFVYIMCIIAFM